MRIIAAFLVLWLAAFLFLQGQINALEKRVTAIEQRVQHLEEIADVEVQP